MCFEGVGGGDFWNPVGEVLQVAAPAAAGAIFGPALLAPELSAAASLGPMFETGPAAISGAESIATGMGAASLGEALELGVTPTGGWFPSSFEMGSASLGEALELGQTPTGGWGVNTPASISPVSFSQALQGTRAGLNALTAMQNITKGNDSSTTDIYGRIAQGVSAAQPTATADTPTASTASLGDAEPSYTAIHNKGVLENKQGPSLSDDESSYVTQARAMLGNL